MEKRYFRLRKLSILLLLLLSIFIYTGCDDNTIIDKPIIDNDLIEIDYLDIYSINDLHGAVEDANGRGMARIGNYLMEKKASQPKNTIILAAGDMFQGTGVSNLTYGGVVVEALNTIGIDAFTIGNHEFDWGDQKIIDFKNNSDQVQANFPFLGANIYRKSTNQRAEWVDAYTIIDRGGLKVGIIGTLGDYQINSITAPYVEAYKFVDPVSVIREITFDLRANQDVDVIIVSAHDAESSQNRNFFSRISNLMGSYKIDALINAHTHQVYAREITRKNSANLPVVQAGSSGSHIGHIRLNIDRTTKEVTSTTVENIKVDLELSDNHPEILATIEKYLLETNKVLDEYLVTAGQYISESSFGNWAVDVLHKYSNADFAIVNAGAFRSGFPVYQDQRIDVRRVFEFMPFDNLVLTSEVTKSQLAKIAEYEGLHFSSNFNNLEDGKYYTIATVDYLFYKTSYPFFFGRNHNNLNEYFRDYLISELKSYHERGIRWYLNN